MHFLQSNKALVATVFLICIAPFSILSQSQSSLYQKAEVAYDEYNYAFLLDNKDALLKQYGQKDDTLSANIHSFIAEAFFISIADFLSIIADSFLSFIAAFFIFTAASSSSCRLMKVRGRGM